MQRAARGSGFAAVACLATLALLLPGAQAAGRVTPLEEWTGVWVTSFGQMVLKQTGKRVTGRYNWDGGRIVATVGSTTGGAGVLQGTWTELPTRKAPKDAGHFSWIMNRDLQRFAGRFGYGTDDHHGGIWVGTRFVPEATVLVSVRVKTIAGANGRVTGRGIDCRAAACTYALPGTYGMPKGTLTLVARPAAGSRFAGWGGACTGTSPTCKLTLTGRRTAVATFGKAAG